MTAILIRLVALIAIFASVFVVSQFILASTLNRRAEHDAVNKRLKLLRSGLTRDAVVSILRNNLPKRLPENAGILDRISYKFQQTVRTAGLTLEPRNVLILIVIAFVITLGLLFLAARSSGAQFSVGVIELILGIAVAIAVGLPLMFLSRMAQRRRTRMQEQFPLALDIFVRSLRVGHPIATAIDLLTQEVEDPLGSEFGLVSDEVAYGASLNDALLGLADRWELEDIKMFVICVAVQSETGGNLAEILENLSGVIRDRASLYLKVRALSSEGRMSGWMLTALPVLTLVSMFIVSPEFYLKVAGDPIFIYGFSGLVVLYFIGVLIIRRMIDLKV